MNYKLFKYHDSNDDYTMPILLNKRELEVLSDNDIYKDHMIVLMKICEMDDSYGDENYKCDNLKNNEDWSDIGLDYAGYFN